MTALPKTEPIEALVDLRVALLSNGYTPVPVLGKGPRIKGWRKFRPTRQQIPGQARSHADHTNTGILTGQIVAIDIDVPDEDASRCIVELASSLTGSKRALRRVGRAPKTMIVFRTSAPRNKTATPRYTVNGHVCQIEVMGDGQQFVAYGTHPDTGRQYEWIGPSPLDVPASDLPEIDFGELDAFLARASEYLSSVGTAMAKEPAAAPKQTSGTTFWQQVNSAALANADAWVNGLFTGARKEPGTGAWRISSKALGRSLEEDISIHSDGIRDFGTEKAMTAIDLVVEFGGAPTSKDAAFWLCERLGQAPEAFGWGYVAPVRIGFGAKKPAVVADNDDEETEDEVYASSGAAHVAITYPPGAVGDFARFIESCSRFPSRELSLVSALALVAGLAGRRYKGPTGFRTNIYIIGLAESGFGKDITIRANEAIANSTVEGVRVSEHLFADKIRSLPGLVNRLQKSPSAICVIDEFGKFLGLHTARNAAPHREEIAAALLELTGAPSTSWGGQEKAAGNIPRIQSPCLTIHGVSTPHTFWEALSSGSIDEGLLARIVVLDAGRGAPKKVRRPAGDIENIPPELSSMVMQLMGGGGKWGGGVNYALNADASTRPAHVTVVPFEDEAVEEIWEGFDSRMRGMRSKIDPQYHSVLNRAGENAGRLALIVAIGCAPLAPVITADIQEWANRVAEASFWTIVKGAGDNIADNERSKEYLKVKRIVDLSGDEGVTQRIMDRKLRGSIDERRLSDIITTLRRSREISLAEAKAKSGQKRRRFWARGFLPEGAEVIND